MPLAAGAPLALGCGRQTVADWCKMLHQGVGSLFQPADDSCKSESRSSAG